MHLCVTCHWVKQLVGLEVGEGGGAAGAVKGRSVCRVALIRLNAPPHVIQFILDYVDQDSAQT